MQQRPHTVVLIFARRRSFGFSRNFQSLRHLLRFSRVIVLGMTTQKPVTDNRSIPLPKIIWYIGQDLVFRTLVTFSFFSPLAAGFRFPIT